ncbi:hypothetical protein JKP88DRAFT_225695 [Tribonema minus]|uniref:Uncharacterized protein n=1 Tax=Tribonema minus TaxID=303371 RepID=A0A836C9Y3_9STRA|nr:hypothetical protein JKP88DRAFT_225695 [Tribonema minus]
MSKNSGITCLANDSASGQVLRSAAAAAEASVTKSNRFSPCSVTELTSWVGSGTYAYSDQDERHKGMVREAYWCNVIREVIAAETPPPTSAQGSEIFNNLGEDAKDKWCTHLGTMHAVMAYALWTILVPFYIAERSKMGNRSHHWRPLEPDATLRKERMQAYTVLKAAMASDYVKRAPADVLLLDHYDWNLTQDDERLRDTFLTTRRQMRADVTVSRALDRGGLKSKKAAGRIPDAEDDSLRDMMRALRKQTWSRVWWSIIAPWLRAHDVPQELQSFLNTSASAAEEGDIVKFADSKGFTRSQVWRDSVIEEYELSKRDGKVFYTLHMTRAFKTASCKDKGLPQLAKWELSEVESVLVHCVLLLCRPMLATGAKTTAHMFLNAAGAPVTQRWIKTKVGEVGKEWLGVPRLGPHSLRTMWLSWMINGGHITEADFESLASYVQVSRCTMLESYVTPSHNGPAQRVGQLMRDGGLNAHVPPPTAPAKGEDECSEQDIECDTSIADTASTAAASDTTDEMDGEGGEESGGRPYGKALGLKRKAYKDNIMQAVQAYGGDAKNAFDALVRKRKHGSLSAKEQWFREDVTFFRDVDLPTFKKLCTK